LAERARALAEQPIDLTGMLLGDPVPSRSALHRPKTASRRRWHEPLDYYKLARLAKLIAKRQAANGTVAS
jgi:hypothetical protein